MNGTPRLRSAFPNTPPARRTPNNNVSPSPGNSTASFSSPKLRDISELSEKKPSPLAPLVPLDTIDAPKQRLYVAAVWVLLFSYRLYDFLTLVQDEEESLWLFMKWIAIDGCFLFGLPSMRIPWLEWSTSTMIALFAMHAIFDGFLMFRIPIPLTSSLVALAKMLYDSEIAISEHHVKPASILHDSSHISGAYTIHVLPEGSALLNPQHIPICLDGSKSAQSVLPLQINQTLPTSIELIRFDLQKPYNETIKIAASQTKKLIRTAEKKQDGHLYGALVLEYPVTKPGLYRLGRVMDETNMEVGHPISESLIVQCPKASVKSAGPSRCRGELSNIALEVVGSPPLKIKYRKTVNGDDRDVSYQSIQPEDFVSPLLKQSSNGAGPLVSVQEPDLSWAGAHRVSVPLNETLSRQGLWTYSIDEVSDAHGNIVSYANDDTDYEVKKPKAAHLEDQFMVYDRPLASLAVPNQKGPIRVAKGSRSRVPIRVAEGGKRLAERDYTVNYRYTPLDDIPADGQHAEDAKIYPADFKNLEQASFSKPGLYSLASVDSEFCSGDVEEPASFMLVNPPEPQLQISSQEISDKCAGKPVGLHVDLSLEGTPDFKITYTAQRRGGSTIVQTETFQGPRGQLDLRPNKEGHWTYKFVQLDDSVYKGVDLRSHSGLTLEQEVRPSVDASFASKEPTANSCIDDSVDFEVRFSGEGPWTLEYELVHGRSREKHKIESAQDAYKITTPPLTKGGEYSLALVGVTDKEGCREALQHHAKISVRHQRPRASFGLIEGKRSIRTLESRPVELPVRLTGEGPWSVDVQHSLVGDDGVRRPGQTRTVNIANPNDFVSVSQPGVYEITKIRDRLCPGTIDDKAQSFDVSLVARPMAYVPESALVEKSGDKFIRKDVCEGDEDAFDLMFTGRPPYDVKYQEHFKPDTGSKSMRNSEMNVPMNSAKIKFDTSRAGLYDYKLTELSDYNYDHEPKQHNALTIQQRVHGRPTASFDTGNKVHSFCQSKFQSSESEQIPVTLTGLPPFTVELEVRHATASKASKPQTLTIPNLMSHSVSLTVPHRYLQPGSSTINVHRIRDARGCERIYDSAVFLTSSSNTQRQAALANAPPRMQVAVHDAPHLTPLEPEKVHHCVGDRLAFALSGTAPFSIQYSFRDSTRKASVAEQTFRRIAETPGNFTIQSISDSASACRAPVRGVSRLIHALPRVRVSKGKAVRYDIHAGGSVDVLFEFEGDPPFTFTYERREAPRTRPAAAGKANAAGTGPESRKPGKVLGSRTLVADDRSLRVSETQEGTYEVVAISDRWCRYARPGYEAVIGAGARGALAAPDRANLLQDADDDDDDNVERV